ncbi:hypothetical protein EON65_52820 [archaeon]|nr:MAG: hypothetical protein EON65_52820 [archaeon]
METLAPHDELGFVTQLFYSRYKRLATCNLTDSVCVNSEVKSFLLSSQDSIWIDRWVRMENHYNDFIKSIAEYSKGRITGPLNMTLVEMVIAEQTEKEKLG